MPNLKHEPQYDNISGLRFAHTSVRSGINFFHNSSSLKENNRII